MRILKVYHEMEQEPLMHKKRANIKCERVKVDESFVPGLEDEAFQVEHLLAEPKNDQVLVDDGVLSLDKENQGKVMKIEDIPCRFEDSLKSYRGGLDSNITWEGEDELNLGVLDGILDEVEEVDDLQATNCLSSPCEDYLLDIEFADEVSGLDCGPCEGSHIGNSCSESQSPGFSGSSDGAVGVSELSQESIPEPKCKNDMLDRTIICKLHDSFSSKCGCQMPGDKMSLKCVISHESRDHEPNKSSFEASGVGALLRLRRTRKPTQRYIEESSDPKSRHFGGRQKVSPATSKDKSLKTRSSNEHHHSRVGALELVEEKKFGEASIKAPFEFQRRRGRPRKPAIISRLESDEDTSATESEDDRVMTKRSKKGDRRKHQRMWTLSEAMKVVDGVSLYGVGRWTDIKRLLFSSSPYRTPLDIRDKWRNLLRASCAQKPTKREVEDKQKHALRPLPKSVLHRISELAAIHPYPRCNSRKSREGVIASPILPAARKGTPVSSNERNVRRKKIN